MWQIVSWIAVVVGLTGTWLAARHPSGWLLGAACNFLWLGFDLYLHIWAGSFSAVLGIALSIRNWFVTRRR